jgi:hypothetical protein
MGGLGSGRPPGKESINDYAYLDVRYLQRRGLLVPGLSSSWQWKEDDGEGASIDFRVEVGRLILSRTLPFDCTKDCKSSSVP